MTDDDLEREAPFSRRLRLVSFGTFKADSSRTEELSPVSTREGTTLGPDVIDRYVDNNDL